MKPPDHSYEKQEAIPTMWELMDCIRALLTGSRDGACFLLTREYKMHNGLCAELTAPHRDKSQVQGPLSL